MGVARGGLFFDGIGGVYATFALHAAVSAAAFEGCALALTGDGQAGLGSAGDVLLGKLVKYHSDGYGTVQVGGCMELPAVSGSWPTVGGLVAVDGAGKVQAAAVPVSASKWYRGVALSVDETANTAVVLLA